MKIKKSLFAPLFAIALFVGCLSFNSNEANAQSLAGPSLGGATHSCVTVQDTPTHKDVRCIGSGTACETVAIC